MAAKVMNSGRVFLTAQWRHLAMLNYVVDPGLLQRFVPAGTDLDLWNGQAFLSLVGFRFLNTRVFGISFPFHSDFEEVNLRFYVRRHEGPECKRGVVFIREIVPRRAIAILARLFYGENYVALPMSHRITPWDAGLAVVYEWKYGRQWNRIDLKVSGDPAVPQTGSEEQFITEHYWGYARQQNNRSIEYQVAHPSWKVWNTRDARFDGDMEKLYGKDFATILKQAPASAFLAEGSEVTVFRGRTL
jgi:uncharacterized protein